MRLYYTEHQTSLPQKTLFLTKLDDLLSLEMEGYGMTDK
jgi:hypothetical protein